MNTEMRRASNNKPPAPSSVNASADHSTHNNPIIDDWDSDPNVHTVKRRKSSNRGGNTQQRGPSGLTYTNAVVSGRSGEAGLIQEQSQQQTNRPSKPRVTMLGSSASTAFKAAKTLLIRKAVFKINNVDAGYSAENLIDHLTTMGVRLTDDVRTNGKSCFELKRGPHQPEDNKSFRICIFAADKTKLLVKDHWASGILIQEWIFRSKDDIALSAQNDENIRPPVPQDKSPKNVMDTNDPLPGSPKAPD